MGWFRENPEWCPNWTLEKQCKWVDSESNDLCRCKFSKIHAATKCYKSWKMSSTIRNLSCLLFAWQCIATDNETEQQTSTHWQCFLFAFNETAIRPNSTQNLCLIYLSMVINYKLSLGIQKSHLQDFGWYWRRIKSCFTDTVFLLKMVRQSALIGVESLQVKSNLDENATLFSCQYLFRPCVYAIICMNPKQFYKQFYYLISTFFMVSEQKLHFQIYQTQYFVVIRHFFWIFPVFIIYWKMKMSKH